jgi:hypothetical protein
MANANGGFDVAADAPDLVAALHSIAERDSKSSVRPTMGFAARPGPKQERRPNQSALLADITSSFCLGLVETQTCGASFVFPAHAFVLIVVAGWRLSRL